jgi:hypothetical protein
LAISELRQGIVVGKIKHRSAPDRLKCLIARCVAGIFNLRFGRLIMLLRHHTFRRTELWRNVTTAVISGVPDRDERGWSALNHFSPYSHDL